MADIFISYSKADHQRVRMLVAYLESDGWSVWWDTNLTVGDAYRDEIMKQLTTARAVVVVWTPTSIKSDFVRAEAGAAKRDGKLIPVKDGVSYGDIPLPFGEMHTEDLSKRELIRAAVVAQLAKPVVQPSALWMASRVLRFQLFTWVGIVGGVITIFTHLKEVLHLAEWAKWLVVNWQWLTLAFWQFWFGWIGVRLSETAALALSLATFTIAVSVGARSDYRRAPDPVVLSPKAHRRQQRWARQFRWVVFPLLLAGFVALVAFTHWRPVAHQTTSQLIVRDLGLALLFLVWGGSSYVFPMATARYSYVDRAIFMLTQGFVFAAFIMPFGFSWSKNMTGDVLDAWEFLHAMVLVTVLFLPTIIMLLIAPMRALNGRLSFLALGVLMLVGLNHLSQYAPEIREWLRPPV